MYIAVSCKLFLGREETAFLPRGAVLTINRILVFEFHLFQISCLLSQGPHIFKASACQLGNCYNNNLGEKTKHKHTKTKQKNSQ